MKLLLLRLIARLSPQARLLILSLSALIALQSCGTLIKPPDQSATGHHSADGTSNSLPVNDPPTATTDTTEQPKGYATFSTDTLYALLVAELAATRGQYDLTLNNYLAEAVRTQDTGVIARAARLAQYFRRQTQALAMGQLWLSKAPDNLEANTLVANAHIALRQPVKALEYAEVILARLDPQEEGAQRRAALVETIASHSREAATLTREILIDRYQQLSRHYPDYPALPVGLSILQQDGGDTATAYQVIQQVLAENSDYMPAILQEIRLLRASEQTDKALAKLNRQLTRQPDNQRLRLIYARLLSEVDLQASYEEFTRLSQQAPRQLDITFSRALVAMELQKRALAEELLVELLALRYRPDTIHFYLGSLAELDQRPRKALSHYLSVSGGEQYVTAHSRAARIMAGQGSIEQAREYFVTLREQSPEQKPQLYAAEAEVLGDLGHGELALAVLTEGVRQYPDDITLRYNRATLYEQSNQLALMESDLRHILSLEPDNASALNALGYFLTTRTDRHQEALLLIEQALDLQPDDPAIIDSMGWVLFNLGRIDEAIVYLRKAFERFPDPEIAAHLGEALWVNGNKQEARGIWQQNLVDNPDDSRILDTMERLRVEP